MDNGKEFTGKSIDEAIEEACAHFGAPREKLEIEIISDAKAGIFGLVGNKKASIRVKPREDSQELRNIVTTVVDQLTTPIVGPVKLEVEIEEGRAKVVIHSDADSGLLIGRDGQTLSSLQFLANRIVAKRWPDNVRVQLDTGDYRERQDDNLRNMALDLAERAKSNGRPQSTRPLSSYHRRVVHLALQDDEAIQTRSKGDGPMKRVLIYPRRGRQQQQQQQQQRQSPIED